MDLITRKINNNTLDAFFGEGFSNFGRFKLKFGRGKTEIFQIKGIRYPASKMTELSSRYNNQN